MRNKRALEYPTHPIYHSALRAQQVATTVVLGRVFHPPLRGLCDIFPPPLFLTNHLSFSVIFRIETIILVVGFLDFIFFAVRQLFLRLKENQKCGIAYSPKRLQGQFMVHAQNLILESVQDVLQGKMLFWLLMNQAAIPKIPSVSNFRDFIVLSHRILITCFISLCFPFHSVLNRRCSQLLLSCINVMHIQCLSLSTQ